MFSGESQHTLDAKHRVFCPKRFQRELGQDHEGNYRLVLTRGFENCLFLFSKLGFDEVVRRLRTQPFGGPRMRNMQRSFFSNVHETQLDSSGRVVLPEKLRLYAGIEKEVVMVGVADRGEIWDRARWEQLEAEGSSNFDELDNILVGDGYGDPTSPSSAPATDPLNN